jgi:hypothetical protein
VRAQVHVYYIYRTRGNMQRNYVLDVFVDAADEGPTPSPTVPTPWLLG